MLSILFFLFSPQAAYGKPAPAATVFRHVPDEAVLVVGVDVASLVQGMNKNLDRLMNAPFVKNSAAMQPVVAMLKGGREAFRMQAMKVGIDPFKDIRYLMAAMAPTAEGERSLVVVGGKMPKNALELVGGMMGGAKPEGGILNLGNEVMAQARDGTLLTGSRPWVEKALANQHSHKSWKSLLGDYDRKTWLLAAFRPNDRIRDEWRNEEPAARPLLEHIAGLSIKMTYGGEAIKVVSTDSGFVEVYRGLLEGFGQMSTAAHQFGTGLLTLAEAYLGSLHPVSALAKQLPEEERALIEVLVKNRKAIRKLAQDMLLGKKARASVKANKRKKSATLTIKGSGPSSMMFVGAAVGWFILQRASAAPEPIEAKPAPLPVPAK
jgi:hypothetical protein